MAWTKAQQKVIDTRNRIYWFLQRQVPVKLRFWWKGLFQ